MVATNWGAEQAGAKATAQQLQFWIRGLRSEVDFWDKWFCSRGGAWPDDFEARLHQRNPVFPYLEHVVARCERSPIAILDVGSGPLSLLGSIKWNRPIEVRAIDPLAEIYGAIIRREGLVPPVWPEIGFAEDLSAFLSVDSFDVVYCCNALDHSFDPIRGIWEMINVVRVGGMVVMRHNVNEAVAEGYTGMHQWNFDLKEGRAVLWNREHQHDLTELLAPPCTVTAERLEGRPRACVVYIEKHGQVNLMDDAYKSARIRNLLAALVEVALNAPVNRPTTLQRLRRGFGHLSKFCA